MSTRNNKRNDATRIENANAEKQVKNLKQNTPAPAPQDTPVPAKLEELETRFAEYKKSLSEAKKQSRKASEKLAKASDLVANERYCIAVSRFNIGKADAEDLAIIANRKVAENTEAGLAKLFAKEFTDSEAVAKARELAKGEEGSLSSAIAETLRSWPKCYSTLYATIGITSKKCITPDLLKGISPYLSVATADGLKAATVTRTAVRKNGKAVKVKGKRVYKYTLRERIRWTAYGLYETLERNFRLADLFTEGELSVRSMLLNNQVSALKALKDAQKAKSSDIPEQAAEAADAEGRLIAAVKTAAKALKENADTTTQHTTKGGKLTKVA